MRVEINLKFSKIIVVGVVLLVALAGGLAVYFRQGTTNPLPADIKSQVAYKTIYPAETKQIDTASYAYQSDQKTLSFTVATARSKVVFTEQPAPPSIGTGNQVYYAVLGIHPYAQFQSKLGPVALAKFWQTGNLKPAGQSGILAAGGTLLITHSDKDMTNAEWKNLFDSLNITK